ncbi:MAG: Bax inhibitor-1/YccA family protein [Hyphomicrobiales bacterium]
MAELRYQSRPQTGSDVQIDQGLRSYMLKVYNYMTIGLVITGLAAWATFHAAVGSAGELTAIGQALFLSPLKWLVILAPLAMVMWLSFGVHRMSVGMAQGVFWLYAALVGVSLGSLGLIYTAASITQVFLITAASFGAVSLYGYTTKRDLSGLGSFLLMGLFGIIIAMLVNFFLQSGPLGYALSVMSVLVFTGLTAYDTQAIKEIYYENDDVAVMGRKAIMGALRLYLDFINLFLSLLRLMGNRNS